jgi:hypothetical protein
VSIAADFTFFGLALSKGLAWGRMMGAKRRERKMERCRAWLKKEKVMADVFCVYPPNQRTDKQAFECYGYDKEFQNDDGILMESTGRKDRNGKEIFEWDICRFQESVGQIAYKNLHWFFLMEGGFVMELSDSSCELLEVIGNVYENKELLPVAGNRK